MEFSVLYANVPFFPDTTKVVRVGGRYKETDPSESQLPPRTQQVEADLLDEIERLIPTRYLSDYVPQSPYPGRNLGALTYRQNVQWQPPEIKPGTYFYPNDASRWSIFRGLATSSQVAAMLAAVKVSPGSPQWTAQPFVLRVNPLVPNHADNDVNPYTIVTNLFMLPPRPLGETKGTMDGLYLVTLVDERYYWQWQSISLQVNQDTMWEDVLTQLASALNISLNFGGSIPEVYGQPEPDSQLFCNEESAPYILDCVAANFGATVVRNYDGTYLIQQPAAARGTILANRPLSTTTVRYAGGDIFNSDLSLPVGGLTWAANGVIPSAVATTFPSYIMGDDPVPHMVNNRYRPQRPSSWYEESYGEVATITVPITSGGFIVAGLVGVPGYTHTIHNTAKALYSGEIADIALNTSGLTALAMQIANDYYENQINTALDEVYPGTYAWIPEAINDILFTWSVKNRIASTRVMRSPWNLFALEMQHGTPPVVFQQFGGMNSGAFLSGSMTDTPRGVGGPSVAQTWQDNYDPVLAGITSGGITTFLADGIVSGQDQITVSGVSWLPTQNRWRAIIDGEIFLLEGTSGGVAVGPGGIGVSGNAVASGALDINIVYRGIDGTIELDHGSGTMVSLLTPNTTYGVNLASVEKGQFVYPGAWTSGGIQEAVIVPQTQSVYVFSASGQFIDGAPFFSGQIGIPDTTQVSGGEFGSMFNSGEFVWVYERNLAGVTSGAYYDGQLAGYSAEVAPGEWIASGNVFSAVGHPVAPVYLVNAVGSGGGGGTQKLVPNVSQAFLLGNVLIPTNTPTIVSGSWTFAPTTDFVVSGGSFVCQFSGVYQVTANILWNSQVNSGSRWIGLGPPPVLGGQTMVAPSGNILIPHHQTTAWILNMISGSFFDIRAFQTCGTNLAILAQDVITINSFTRVEMLRYRLV